MKELLTFPKNFWWGSAWSAEQAEGRGDTGKAKTVWEHWFETEPNRFYEGVGSEITTDHFNRYKEDVQWMKKTGQNSFRSPTYIISICPWHFKMLVAGNQEKL